MIANIASDDALILRHTTKKIEFSGTTADFEENNNQQFC